MRRLLAILTVLLLSGCSPDELSRLFHGDSKPPQSAVRLILQAETAGALPSPETLDAAAAVIRRRLDLLGIPAEVTVTGDAQITVALHHIDESMGDVGTLVTRPGRIEFVDMRNAPPELVANPNDALLATSAHPTLGEHIDPLTGAPYLTVIDAVQVIDAHAAVSQFSNTWDIALTFSPEHGALLSEFTSANIGTTLGILIDGRLLSAPRIQAQVGDEAVITGNFSEVEARQLAAVIGGGELPFALTVAEMR